MREGRGFGRRIAVATVIVVAVALGGAGLAGAATSAPSTITVCTKTSTGKTKVIAPSLVAKCTQKGKGVAKSWPDPAPSLLNLSGTRSATVIYRNTLIDMKAEDCAIAASLTDPNSSAFVSILIANSPGVGTYGQLLGERCFNYVVPALPTVTVPSALTTCTKNSTGKTKVIAASAVAQCTYKGKGAAKSWYTDAALTNAQSNAATQASQFILDQQFALLEQCGYVQAIRDVTLPDPDNPLLPARARLLAGIPTLVARCGG